MARIYLAVVQAVLLYGSESWTITRRNMGKLESFHKRAVRHMTGVHIRKCLDGTWVFPEHGPLFEKCRLLPIGTYIARRRSTLRGYLEMYKADLWREVQGISPPALDAQKILWWRQSFVSREEMAKLNRQWGT